MSPVLRLRAPREGETVIDDVVQGRVVVPNTQLDDMIILRSDGSPIYNFAVVVDDHDMGITHVIRGVDHLTNAARQVQIYKALGWRSVLAHIPLILGPDGKKLSKRHGAPGLESFRATGFLPRACATTSPGSAGATATTRFLHRRDDRVVRHRRHQQGAGAARPRQDGRCEQPLHPPGERREPLARVKAFLPEAEGGAELAAAFDRVGWHKLAAAVPSLKGRAKTLRELVDGAGYLIAVRPLSQDEKAAKTLDTAARARLGGCCRSWRRPTCGRRQPWRPSCAPSARPRGPEARRCGAAAQGGADGHVGVAAGVRRDGRAGAGGDLGAPPGRGVLERRFAKAGDFPLAPLPMPRAECGAASAWSNSRCISLPHCKMYIRQLTCPTLSPRLHTRASAHRRPRTRGCRQRTSPMSAKDADAGKTATMSLGSNRQAHLPVRSGTIGPDVIDVGRSHRDTGCFTYDPGFTSTANCSSRITYIDGDEGVLLYRGYPIEQLAQSSTFIEVCYLLLNGELPSKAKFETFRTTITRHTMVHEQMTRFFTGFRRDAHPMAIMCGSVGALSAFYHDFTDINDAHQRMVASHRLVAKMPTLAAMAYKYSIGQPFIDPRNDLDYTSNFLQMSFAVPCEPYVVNPIVSRALDRILILHADHEQNASTSTVRLAGSRAPTRSPAPPPASPACGGRRTAAPTRRRSRCWSRSAASTRCRST